MKKFLHIVDPHLLPLNRRPSSRAVRFHEQVANKMEHVRNVVWEQGIDAMFISGDIFHLKNSNLYTPEYINHYSKMFESFGVPIYTIPGNHDFPKSSFAEWDKTAYLSLVRSTENMIDVSNSHELLTTTISDKIQIQVLGLPYLPLEETVQALPRINDRAGELKEHSKSVNILMMHTDVLPDPGVFLFWKVWGYDNLLDAIPNIDIFCLGHIHQSFPIYKRKNPTSGRDQFVSKPWSFTRVAKDYFNNTEVYEHQHKPSYSILKFDDTSFDLEYHEIPHVPGTEAFESEALKKRVERSKKVQTFLDDLESMKLEEGQNLFEMLSPEQVLNSMKLTDEVRQMVDIYLERSGVI